VLRMVASCHYGTMLQASPVKRLPHAVGCSQCQGPPGWGLCHSPAAPAGCRHASTAHQQGNTTTGGGGGGGLP
jgi:hypothetical protein